MERLAPELIELSIRQNFAISRTIGAILRGWARSASGETDEGISSIEDRIEDYRATGWMVFLPIFLALKAEALHLADRTFEALEAIKEAEALAGRSEERWWSADCTGCAVCFWRPWVLTRPKLKFRFAQPSESQRSRSRFRSRNAPKEPTQNIAGEKGAGQEDVDSDSYIASPLRSPPSYYRALIKLSRAIASCSGESGQ